MPSQNITSSEFESLINEKQDCLCWFLGGLVVRYVSNLLKFMSKFQKKYPDIKFAKVNIEAEQELADFFEIRSIPHLMVFKDSIVIYSNAGSMPASTLNELVEQAVAKADVSAIKAQFDEEDGKK